MPSRFRIGQQIKPSRTAGAGFTKYPALKFGKPAAAAAAAKPAVNPALAQWTPQQIAAAQAKYAPAYSGPTAAQINQTALKFRNTLPAALSNQQIQQRAQASIDPVIDKITAAINARVAGSQKAVTGYTNTLASNLAADAHTLSDPYTQGAERSAAVTQALSDRLASGGQASGADLATRLQAVGGPAVDQTVAATQAAGGASGNALFASGSADVQELLKNAASAQSYGNKLPGIARLGGQQQIGLIGQQGVTDTAEQVGAAQGQLPTIVQNLRSMSEDRSSNRASLYDRMYEYLTSQGVEGRANARSNAADLFTTLQGQNVTRAGLAAGYDEKAAAANQPTYIELPNGEVISVDKNGNPTTVHAATPPPAKEPKAPTTRRGADGSMQQWDPTTQTWIDAPGAPKPTPKPDPAKDPKARQSALVSASTKLTSLLTAAAKPVKVTVPAKDAYHDPTTKLVKPPIGSAAYNAAVNRGVAAVRDALSPYMTDQQIVQWVQAKARAGYFAAAAAAPTAAGSTAIRQEPVGTQRMGGL
jgi:hypothetical protein